MLLCGNNVQKQQSSLIPVHLLLYEATKQMLHLVKSYYNI
jgi:hypothetical protein